MASGLKAKLNAMSSAAPKAKKRETGRGLVCRVSREVADERLYDLSGAALRRIGWNGRKFDVEKCLFLDTETTGLSGGAGTVAFLVGVGYVRDGELVIEQYMMSDYSDEAELLMRVGAIMQNYECVVTFNGKTFDMPLLNTRFTLARMREMWVDLENLDLLFPARRVWKMRLGSCRLGNLEERILGMEREGDVPGSEVPQRFFDFLKTGDMSLLEDVIEHNRQDIASLATLLVKLCEVYDSPCAQQEKMDLFSLGKALEKQGESAEARELYRLSAVPEAAGSIQALRQAGVSEQANWRLFLLSRRTGDYETAKSTLEVMIHRRQMGDIPYEEMAKLYEHRFGDPERALDYACCAIEKAAPERVEAHQRRIDRLRKKIEQKAGKEELKKWRP